MHWMPTYIDMTNKTVNGVLIIIGVYMLMISACKMFYLKSNYIKFRYNTLNFSYTGVNY